MFGRARPRLERRTREGRAEAGRARASCLPTSEPPAEGTGCSGAAPPAAHRSFPALNNGRNRSSPVPGASALGAGTVTASRTEAGQGQPLARGHSWRQRRCGPSGAMPSRVRDAPRPLATSPAMGLKEEELGSRGGRGGHPQEAALFLGLRFKETQDAQLSASHCGRCHRAAWPTPARVGEGRVGRRPSPSSWTPRVLLGWPYDLPRSHPDCWKSLVHPPCSCSWSPRCPFWAFSTQSSSDGTSSRKSACPRVGQMPTPGSCSLSGLPPPQP